MYGQLYFDQQTITIVEVASPYGLKTWQFDNYVSITLREEAVVDPDDIIRVVEQANLDDPTSFTIDDVRHYMEWGASGAGHEVFITVAAGLAGGIATTVTSRLPDWLRDRRAGHDEPIDLSQAVKLSEAFLREQCKVPGKLELSSSELGEKGHTVVWHSRRTKSVFSVFVSRSGRIIHVNRRSD